MFGEIAGWYDFLNHALSMGIDRRWRRLTTRLVPPPDEAPVLDVCTGTADLAVAYWEAGGRRGEVVGVDFCRPMLRRGREKVARLEATEHIRLIEGDASALPFAADQFALVCVAFGLRNISDTDRGLAEMVRVCRAPGQVAVLEFSRPRNAWLRRLYGWYFHRVLPRVGQALSRNRQAAYSYLPASVGEFPEGEALGERMRNAGLIDVWFRPLTFGIATLYVGRKPARQAPASDE
jgi:demethylmenaquinone methyltransferase/2-methoxy-6-polyprenyl-1,4-benzoquinol methylase